MVRIEYVFFPELVLGYLIVNGKQASTEHKLIENSKLSKLPALFPPELTKWGVAGRGNSARPRDEQHPYSPSAQHLPVCLGLLILHNLQ